ncbi:MAG: DUF971 domain-containing protein [Planctomycetota bacterium]
MTHRPIQFDSDPPEPPQEHLPPQGLSDDADLRARPVSIDLKKELGLTVTWDDGRVSVYPVRYLRRMSPSAEARVQREEMARNPLTVLPSQPSSGGSDAEPPFHATGAELVGNYALRIVFSDGHRTGLYTWPYLREIDPNRPRQNPGNNPDASVKP